eukprot:s5491_g4.t1
MLRLNHCVGISKTKFKTVGLLFGTVIIKERRGRKDLSNLHVKDGDVITLEAGSSWRWKEFLRQHLFHLGGLDDGRLWRPNSSHRGWAHDYYRPGAHRRACYSCFGDILVGSIFQQAGSKVSKAGRLNCLTARLVSLHRVPPHSALQKGRHQGELVLGSATSASYRMAWSSVEDAPETPIVPEEQPGVTKPLGFFDPLGFSKSGLMTFPGDSTGFKHLRTAEIKHGRFGAAVAPQTATIGTTSTRSCLVKTDGACVISFDRFISTRVCSSALGAVGSACPEFGCAPPDGGWYNNEHLLCILNALLGLGHGLHPGVPNIHYLAKHR